MKNLYKYFSIIAIISIFTCCATDIVDVTGSISGIVKDYTTGLTVENCQVALSPSGNSVSTDANGRYTFDNLNPGTYTLTFTKIGYMDQSASVELLAGQSIIKDVQLETTEAFTVSTSVLDFGDSNATLSFSLQNHTATKCNFNIVNNIKWLKLSQTDGTIQANNKLNITATVDRSLVGYDSYDKTITINYTGATSGNVVLRIVMQKAEIAKPSVTTNEATDITANSFSISGQITSTGGEKVTAYGHCWSYDPHPTIDNEHTDLGQTTESLRFNSKVYCPLVDTVVYVRAYAKNSQGVNYSNEVQVTTPKGDDPSTGGDSGGDSGNTSDGGDSGGGSGGSVGNSDFAGGTGSAYDPYLIKTAASMMRMRDYPDAHFALAADIDMEGYAWIPIPLNTSFEGNDYTIYNLTISPYVTSDKLGLFSEIAVDGSVTNLTLNNVNINFLSRSNIGAIAGVSEGEISHCHIILTKAQSIIGNENVGGVVGTLMGDINDCSVSATATSPTIIGSMSVGGAIGATDDSYWTSPSIANISVNASIDVTSQWGGGIIGSCFVSVKQCEYSGTITANNSGAWGIGGIVGDMSKSSGNISACKANVYLKVKNAKKSVGGILGSGLWGVDIIACYAQGGVEGFTIDPYLEHKGVGIDGSAGNYNNMPSVSYCYTLFDYSINHCNESFSIYDLVSQFNSPINIAELMRANCSSEASQYWDFSRTWTWKGSANGKTVTAICPKLKWEK